jgi:esterase/lipase
VPRILLLIVAATILAPGCAGAPPGFGPVPRNTSIDYESAVASVLQRQAADDSVVARGGRSILMTHGSRTPRVFVLLHGFTDAPTQFASLGARLFATGDNVYIPRLPHHAEKLAPVRTLGRVRAAELASFGDSVVDTARGLGDTIIVAGLSAGGGIAAYLSQTRREVHRAVLIAPAIAAGLVSEDDGRLITAIAARLPEVTRTNKPDSTRPDFVQGLTTHGLAEVLRLGQLVRDKANDDPPAGAEMAFLLNENDHTVSEEASMELARSWYQHGARVTVYRFPAALGLPHNLMETAARGGNPDLVMPVVEALVRSAPPPAAAELQPVQPDPCSGVRCAARRVLLRPE